MFFLNILNNQCTCWLWLPALYTKLFLPALYAKLFLPALYNFGIFLYTLKSDIMFKWNNVEIVLYVLTLDIMYTWHNVALCGDCFQFTQIRYYVYLYHVLILLLYCYPCVATKYHYNFIHRSWCLESKFRCYQHLDTCHSC